MFAQTGDSSSEPLSIDKASQLQTGTPFAPPAFGLVGRRRVRTAPRRNPYLLALRGRGTADEHFSG